LYSLCLSQNYKIALERYISVLEALRQESKVVRKRIRQIAQEDHDAMLWVTIPGVGYYSALTIKSEIGDVRRFLSAPQLYSYVRLVPLDICLRE